MNALLRFFKIWGQSKFDDPLNQNSFCSLDWSLASGVKINARDRAVLCDLPNKRIKIKREKGIHKYLIHTKRTSSSSSAERERESGFVGKEFATFFVVVFHLKSGEIRN